MIHLGKRLKGSWSRTEFFVVNPGACPLNTPGPPVNSADYLVHKLTHIPKRFKTRKQAEEALQTWGRGRPNARVLRRVVTETLLVPAGRS